MVMHNASMVSDLTALATVALVALLAAWPAHTVLRRAKRGRARSAVAYLLGFLAGVAATMAAVTMLGPWAGEEAPIALAGMLAAFVGPFVGIAHGKLLAPARRSARRAGMEWRAAHTGR